MKVYFTGSLHNKDINQSLYEQIVFHIRKLGHDVKADHILDSTIVAIDKQKLADRSKYYKNLNKWIASADLVVCEVSYPSTLNIGHEITLALDKGKPIVALYQSGREPGILLGINSEKFLLLEYTLDELNSVIDYGLDEASEQIDVRFNFFISPKIGTYLDWMSKNKRIPRAVYLRRLIEEDMKQNKEYQA